MVTRSKNGLVVTYWSENSKRDFKPERKPEGEGKTLNKPGRCNDFNP